MRFSAVIVSAGLAALVSAQATSSSAPLTTDLPTTVSSTLTTSTTVSLTPAQSSQATCLQGCPADDPACRAKCIVVDDSVFGPQNNTVDCLAACPRGNGTATDNANFEDCQKRCIATASILPTTSSTTGSTGTRGSGPATTGTGGSQTSGTGSASSPTTTPNVAGSVQVGVMGALVGLGSLAIVFGL